MNMHWLMTSHSRASSLRWMVGVVVNTSRIFFLCCCSVFLSSTVFALTTHIPLPADTAFVFSAAVTGKNEVLATWSIAPNYYLYRKRIHFSFLPKTTADIRFPQGELKYDNEGKRYEAYANTVTIPIILNTQEQILQLNIDYQGCSKDGFCYPPIHKKVTLHLATQSVSVPTTSFANLLTHHNDVRVLFHTERVGMILLIFAGLGLLLALTPCVLPMIPILASIIVGQKKPIRTLTSFSLALAYVLGSALTYAVAGVIAASIGHSLQTFLQQPWILAIVSGLFVLFALYLWGWLTLPIPLQWQRLLMTWSHQQKTGTYVGVFCMGSLSTLILSPCVTAPLVGVLLYIAETGDQVLGASALFVMGFSMGIPLLLIGLSAGKCLPKSGRWMEIVKKGLGVLMLSMAIWFASPIVAAYIPSFKPAIPSSFVVIHDITEFDQQIAKAKLAHQPVMLDFYADWCESCIIMDRAVFNLAEVQQALSHYVLLRADLSKNSEGEQLLLQFFNVVAPPTILFFNADGLEVKAKRIVGEVKAEEFLTRLK